MRMGMYARSVRIGAFFTIRDVCVHTHLEIRLEDESDDEIRSPLPTLLHLWGPIGDTGSEGFVERAGAIFQFSSPACA